VLAPDGILLRLPFDAKRRIGQHVIEPLPGEPVVRKAVRKHDMVDVVPLDQHVAAAHRVGFRVVVLPERLQAGVGVQFPQVLVRHGQHAPGPTRRVQHRLDDPLASQDVAVRLEQQVHHQPDNLAGREVVARRLVGRFAESPDQFLEDVAHLDVGHRIGVQVDVAELRHHQEQPVMLVQLGDVLLEGKPLEDAPHVGREALDVAGQVPRDLARIVLQPAEGQLARVVERHPRRPVQDRIDVSDLAPRQAFRLLQHLLLGRLQHTIQPPQHRQRQNHPPILIRPIRPPQQIRHAPNETDLVGEVVHRVTPAFHAGPACGASVTNVG